MVEPQPSKLVMGVRFPSPALYAPVAQGTEQRTSNPWKHVYGRWWGSSKTVYLSGIRLRALFRVCRGLVSTADLLLTRCRPDGWGIGGGFPRCCRGYSAANLRPFGLDVRWGTEIRPTRSGACSPTVRRCRPHSTDVGLLVNRHRWTRLIRCFGIITETRTQRTRSPER
jgi:hypothetical protein